MKPSIHWEPSPNCCTYSTVYYSAEKNLIEYLQELLTDPVKGWPCTFLNPLFENLGGLALIFNSGPHLDVGGTEII